MSKLGRKSPFHADTGFHVTKHTLRCQSSACIHRNPFRLKASDLTPLMQPPLPLTFPMRIIQLLTRLKSDGRFFFGGGGGGLTPPRLLSEGEGAYMGFGAKGNCPKDKI